MNIEHRFEYWLRIITFWSEKESRTYIYFSRNGEGQFRLREYRARFRDDGVGLKSFRALFSRFSRISRL